MSEWGRDLGFATTILRRRPFHLLLQVTNRCNMKCDFCDFWPNGVAPREELSLDDFRRLEEELAAMGRFLISVEGGEPFVRPDLLEIVRILSVRHVTALYTNGWYVDEEKAQRLFGAGLANVGVSIDYPDAARHDRRRVLPGATARAWRAVDLFREAAPHGGKQVHVMTVLMEDNWREFEALLRQSEGRGVGHCITLLSTKGFRRAPGASMPSGELSAHLLDLWERYPHFRVFRDYLEPMDRFLGGGELPTCRAGMQSFNIDHVGNVAPCIEKIDRPLGNIRNEPLAEIKKRMARLEEVKRCQDCWTLCRGWNQVMGAGGRASGWKDLLTRMRSH